MSKVQLLIVGALAITSLVAAVVLGSRLINSDPTSSLRSRVLVIIETESRESPWTARVRVSALKNAHTNVVVSGYAPTSKDAEKEPWTPVQVPIKISIVGLRLEGLTCENLELSETKYGELNDTLKQIIESDMNADGPASALSQTEDYSEYILSPENENINEELSKDIFASKADAGIQVFQGSVELWADSRNSWDSSHRIHYNENSERQFIFAQQCTLPPSSVWETRGDADWPDSAYASFLPPQINVVSSNLEENKIAEGEYLDRLAVNYEVMRVDGQKLSESYPSIIPGVFGWGALATVDYYSMGGSSLDYSLPPSYLFEKRGINLENDLTGIFFGGASGVFISSLFGLLAGFSTRQR
ncbi:hypothetical protein ACTXL8_04370 [Glutamicibacter arilaitensis]|uniref:hypothetical protein n=1 Tax=Glutamicibacter arilaitensis TaxID=256701 RepID=UPI003FD367BA